MSLLSGRETRQASRSIGRDRKLLDSRWISQRRDVDCRASADADPGWEGSGSDATLEAALGSVSGEGFNVIFPAAWTGTAREPRGRAGMLSLEFPRASQDRYSLAARKSHGLQAFEN
jgi:hypothetical protein